MSKKKLFGMVGLFSTIGIMACPQPSGPSSDSNPITNSYNPAVQTITAGPQLTIGCLFDSANRKVGNESSVLKACGQAASDFNNQKTGIQITILSRDTGGNPDQALSAIKEMAAQSVKLVVGPETSGELQWILLTSQQLGMILISPSSTATEPQLEQADNVFRLVSDDTNQAAVLSLLMQEDGLAGFTGIARADLWGDDLKRAVATALQDACLKNPDLSKCKQFNNYPFQLIGNDYITYDTRTTDMTTMAGFSGAIGDLGQIFTVANLPSSAPLGLHIEAFEEVVPLLEQIDFAKNTYSPLDASNLLLYGSDGFAGVQALIQSAQASAFALRHQLKAPIFTFQPGFKDKADTQRVLAALGIEDIYAANTYDAVMLLGAVANNLTASPTLNEWFGKIRSIASQTNGITGNLAFNNNGDRAVGYYAIMGLQQISSEYAWVEQRILLSPLGLG